MIDCGFEWPGLGEVNVELNSVKRNANGVTEKCEFVTRLIKKLPKNMNIKKRILICLIIG